MINDFAFNGKGILKKGYGTRPAGVRVDGAAPRGFLRFLSLTAFQAEGCGGGFAANYKKAGPIPVISTEAKRSGEISPPLMVRAALR